MKIAVTILLSSFLWVSCKSGGPYKSCKSYCKDKQDSNIQESKTLAVGPLCRQRIDEAYAKGIKLGYCDDRLHTTEKKQHPDPVQCRLLIYAAQKECVKYPSDSEKTVSGTTIYKGGKVFMVDGKPCTCD